MEKGFLDRDLLYGMIALLDYEPMVYGAGGHYSVGAYETLIGEDYNKQSNLDDADATAAADMFKTCDGEFDEWQEKAIWLREF